MTAEDRAPLAQLLATIDGYRRGEVGVDQMQSALWTTSELLGSPTERHLRDLLQSAESDVELVRFTTEPSEFERRAREIVDSVAAAVLLKMSEANS